MIVIESPKTLRGPFDLAAFRRRRREREFLKFYGTLSSAATSAGLVAFATFVAALVVRALLAD